MLARFPFFLPLFPLSFSQVSLPLSFLHVCRVCVICLRASLFSSLFFLSLMHVCYLSLFAHLFVHLFYACALIFFSRFSSLSFFARTLSNSHTYTRTMTHTTRTHTWFIVPGHYYFFCCAFCLITFCVDFKAITRLSFRVDFDWIWIINHCKYNLILSY